MRRIAVIGLGYAGLPVAVAFARRFPGTLGLDRDPRRVAELSAGRDATASVRPEELAASELCVTADPRELAAADFYVVCVPTPIDARQRPDLALLEQAMETIGAHLRPGGVVVLESTVYPGVTEGLCAPLLERASGLTRGRDFRMAYSPERINPGDPEHGLADTVKVVAAEDPATLALVAGCYRAIVPAGVVEASSIAVAEAAKVIENVQRDLNIALMNELALIFDRLGLDTGEVLDVAATKWNFHRYHPGLVGGHCIGVDPYYLTARAESLGIHPRVILAGRQVNDEMGRHVAAKAVKLILAAGREVRGARVAVLGIAFKPDLPDTRNSRVPEVVHELAEYGIHALVHDPLADPTAVHAAYGLSLVPADELVGLDALVLACPHAELISLARRILAAPGPPRVLLDVLGALRDEPLPPGTVAWRL